jgi:class 3 adenylate cyclase
LERRLAAILAADVVGYSRLMGEEEAGTLARLEGLKAEVLDPLINQHNGRIVKLMGDGFLVEFGSVVDIGINIGDVIVKGEDVYGDGVNVAARLEALAEPGEILVSRTVANHVKGKIGKGFEDLGEQELKNIPEPVQVFRVVSQSEAQSTANRAPKQKRLPKISIIAAALAVLILAAGTVLWLKPWKAGVERASVERMAQHVWRSRARLLFRRHN